MENKKHRLQSNFEFIAETSLRVVRAFSYFFMVAIPLLNYKDLRFSIKTILICLSLVFISNRLLGKIRSK